MASLTSKLDFFHKNFIIEGVNICKEWINIHNHSLSLLENWQSLCDRHQLLEQQKQKHDDQVKRKITDENDGLGILHKFANVDNLLLSAHVGDFELYFRGLQMDLHLCSSLVVVLVELVEKAKRSVIKLQESSSFLQLKEGTLSSYSVICQLERLELVSEELQQEFLLKSSLLDTVCQHKASTFFSADAVSAFEKSFKSFREKNEELTMSLREFSHS